MVYKCSVRWAQRPDRDASPVEFFREHYRNDTTRSELAKIDSGLYRILGKRELLDVAIPNVDQSAVERGRRGGKTPATDFGDDPLAFYWKHHGGITVDELPIVNPHLHKRLRKRDLLDFIPGKFCDDPLAYYREHYDGMKRAELAVKVPDLYRGLQKEKLLGYIPLAGKFGTDLPAYYKNHYDGLTNEQLKEVDQEFYERLLRDEELGRITFQNGKWVRVEKKK
ncbi:hypothetical protein ACFLZX_03330 [Nanoarchaeota archaeon]